jgi:uroporphyrinogen decarboxylase
LALRRQIPDRVPRQDSFWRDARRDLLAGAGEHPDTDIADVFDMDIRSLGFDGTARLDRVTREETDKHVIYTDANGATIRHFRDEQTTGEHMEFAIADRDIWREQFRARYAFDRHRIDVRRAKRLYEHWRRTGRYIVFATVEPFEATWAKCGPTRHFMAYVEDPEWVRDMYAVHTELAEAAFAEYRGAGIEFDGVWFFGDIAYRNSSMVSPQGYCDLLQPFHRRLCAMVHAAGGEAIFHSDGNLHGLLPHLIEAGWDCIQPLEVKAGMDVRQLKAQYGDRVALMGNIDARLFQQNDLAGLEAEIRDKVTVAKEGGGYLYHSDHSVPPGVTFETYRRALELVDHYGKY